MNICPHLKVVGYDDWYGVYVDGVLAYEGHSVDPYHLIEASEGLPFTLSEEGGEALGEWLYDQGRLPANYNDIPKEVLA
jgi:hypothetical protein